MPFRAEEIERECPVDECDGTVLFFTEEGENGPYSDGSYQTWTYLLMDGNQCSEGHTFDDSVIEKMENDATDDYQQSFYYDDL